MRIGVRIKFNSPVILVFVALCFGAMALSILTGGAFDDLLFVTYHSSLKDPLTYVRFFTHVIGHANWTHLIGNMMYILLLGPLLEERYGGKKILMVIFKNKSKDHTDRNWSCYIYSFPGSGIVRSQRNMLCIYSDGIIYRF